MADAPKFISPGSLVEITHRTNAARYFLRPSAELNLAILAILGRALALYPVALHAFVFMSNHWHALVTPCDGLALSRFKQFVHTNIGKAVKRINKTKGKVWASRSADIEVLEEGAQLARLKYLLAHGTKEGLVASPLLWPGLTSARALAGEEMLFGEWVYRAKRASLMRSGRVPDRWEYTERYPITLEPLPVHASLSAEQRIVEVRSMLAQIEAEYPGPHLGVEAVLAQDPEGAPAEPSQRIAPAVHTLSRELRIRFLRMRSEFRKAYRKSAEVHHLVPTFATWHHSGFLPTLQYRPTHRSEGTRCNRRLIDGPPPLVSILANAGAPRTT